MQEKLTFVIFKDHLSSRTLHVSPIWLKRLGMSLIVVTLLTVVAGALFLKSYRRSLRIQDGSDTARVEELEKELTDLRNSYSALQSSGAPAAPPSGSITQLSGGYFSALAAKHLKPLPPRESLPFRLENMKAQWRGSTLTISTAIEYIKEDGGNQQGHFVLLARGPGTVFAYPENAFLPAGSENLIRPESGEYFSVSRYREIKASFGPVAQRGDLQSIELLIFDSSKTLIFAERSVLETLKAGAAEAPKKAAEPKPEAATGEQKSESSATAPSTSAPTGAEGEL